jgi:AcrR family transcriptional regulator
MKAGKVTTKRLSGPERRLQILDEASRLFAFRGLHGTTTKEIAKAAGISEPVLYQHFKNKEDIYFELELLCKNQTAYFRQAIQELGDGIDTLVMITYLLVRVISFSKDPGVASKPKSYGSAEILLRLMGYSFLADGRFARSLVENCIGAFFEQWHESYKVAFKEKQLNIEKIEEVSLWFAYEAIIGFGFFVLPTDRMVDKVRDSDDAAKAATLFLLRGMGIKESVLNGGIHWGSLKKSYQMAIEMAGR